MDDIKEVLDTNYKRLKPLLTDTSVMPKSPPDIEVKRGKITYSPERIVEIQENLQTIQDEFFKLKIIINRALKNLLITYSIYILISTVQ